MTTIAIDPALKTIIPGVSLGVLYAGNVLTERGSGPLWQDIERTGARIKEKIMSMDSLYLQPEIVATRQAYRLFGKDPSRYRGSAEALIRRLLQGKPLYRVNNVVDVNNLVSIQTLLPVGSYDRSRIRGSVVFRTGSRGEAYKGIGKENIDLEGIPVFCDDEGPFGSPTSDSERTMITGTTTDIVTAVISFGGVDTPMSQMVESAGVLFQTYIPGCVVQCMVIH